MQTPARPIRLPARPIQPSVSLIIRIFSSDPVIGSPIFNRFVTTDPMKSRGDQVEVIKMSAGRAAVGGGVAARKANTSGVSSPFPKPALTLLRKIYG
jgi:hypothetical protein